MDTFLFDAFSMLTGGLITDLKTAMVGVLAILLIMIGFELVKRVICPDQLGNLDEANFLNDKSANADSIAEKDLYK